MVDLRQNPHRVQPIDGIHRFEVADEANEGSGDRSLLPLDRERLVLAGGFFFRPVPQNALRLVCDF
jgi:hypothetical protein